jgi:hypothetical protein
MSPVLESTHHQWTVRHVKERGGIAISTTRLAPVFRGIPDVIACYRGLFIAIEVKGDRSRFKKLQRLWQQRLVKAGALVIVARGYKGRELVTSTLDLIDARFTADGCVNAHGGLVVE